MHCFDSRVEFYDEFMEESSAEGQEPVVHEHKYVIRDPKYGKKGYRIASISSTSFIHLFFPSFNDDRVIMQMMSKPDWKDSVYYGMTMSEIKEQWKANGDRSKAAGTYMHDRIETFYNIVRLHQYCQRTPNQTASGSTKEEKVFQQMIKRKYKYTMYERKASKEMQQFYEFHKMATFEEEWAPFRTELRIYDEDLDLGGSIDMLYKHSTYDEDIPGRKNLVMVDWKRSKKINDCNKFEQGYAPLEHLDSCNLNYYSLQLNIYRMILEKYTTYKVVHMALAVFHPSQKEYEYIPVKDMTAEVNDMFGHYLWHNRNPWASVEPSKNEKKDSGFWFVYL